MSDVLRERINDAWDDVFEAIQERTIKRSVGDRFLGRIAAVRSALAETPVTPDLREFRFREWGGSTLVITVDEDDPGDIGEPRTVSDFDAQTTYYSVRARQPSAHHADAVTAIEREAVAAYLASPQAAEELARAGLEHKYAMNERGVIHRCRWRRNSDCAEAILAALRDQRGAS